MKSIWERYRCDEISLNEAVSAYESGGDIKELIVALKEVEYRASVLYIISGLPTEVSRPIWRGALNCLQEGDEQVEFYALDILHTFVLEAAPDELFFALRVTKLQSAMLFKKLFAIILTAPQVLLDGILELAQEHSSSAQHCRGLALLLEDDGSEQRVAKALTDSSLVIRFYGCCAVGRNYGHNARLLALLPEPIRRRLEIIGSYGSG